MRQRPLQREEDRRAAHVAAALEHGVRFGQAVLRNQGADRREHIASAGVADDVMRVRLARRPRRQPPS